MCNEMFKVLSANQTATSQRDGRLQGGSLVPSPFKHLLQLSSSTPSSACQESAVGLLTGPCWASSTYIPRFPTSFSLLLFTIIISSSSTQNIIPEHLHSARCTTSRDKLHPPTCLQLLHR